MLVFRVSAAVAVVSALLISAIARAQVSSAPSTVRKPLPPILNITTSELPKSATLAVQIRKGIVPPHGSTIWHTHPSPTFNYVESGSGTWEFRGQPSQPRSAGQAIEESAGIVTRVVNHGAAPLNLVIFQVSKPGQPVLVPAD